MEREKTWSHISDAIAMLTWDMQTSSNGWLALNHSLLTAPNMIVVKQSKLHCNYLTHSLYVLQHSLWQFYYMLQSANCSCSLNVSANHWTFCTYTTHECIHSFTYIKITVKKQWTKWKDSWYNIKNFNRIVTGGIIQSADATDCKHINYAGMLLWWHLLKRYLMLNS